MEQKNFHITKEKKETPHIVTETISADELQKIIYQDGSIPKGTKFLDKERGGDFKYFDIRKFAERGIYDRKMFYPIVRSNKEIVGICELEKNPHEENTYWISFMSVKDSEQGKGYGSKLAEETFRFAKEKEITIEGSIYSDIGREKLKSKLKELSEKYGVTFIDSDDKHKI
jgi:GNAT superfamily N-acetyltransferase